MKDKEKAKYFLFIISLLVKISSSRAKGYLKPAADSVCFSAEHRSYSNLLESKQSKTSIVAGLR